VVGFFAVGVSLAAGDAAVAGVDLGVGMHCEVAVWVVTGFPGDWGGGAGASALASGVGAWVVLSAFGLSFKLGVGSIRESFGVDVLAELASRIKLAVANWACDWDWCLLGHSADARWGAAQRLGVWADRGEVTSNDSVVANLVAAGGVVGGGSGRRRSSVCGVLTFTDELIE
jgi:hypothetical protein